MNARNGASKWRGRGYWALATGLLPLVNPLLSLLVAAGLNIAWLGAVFLLVLANALVLWLAARAIWSVEDGRHWRVVVGALLAPALSVPLAIAELVIYLDTACPDEGCFN
jgi:hypothetical protein